MFFEQIAFFFSFSFYRYQAIGMNILRSIFRGVDNDDEEQKSPTPNPDLLLNEYTVAELVAGRSIGEAISDTAASGRGLLGWFKGEGWAENRTYEGVQRTGAETGSKGLDNLKYALNNAFTGMVGENKKSAGQIF